MPALIARSRLLPNLLAPHGAASTHLDALRAVAAIGVCTSHLRDTLLVDYSTLPHHKFGLTLLYLATGLGHQWVMVFFVLSGYLVGGSVLRALSAGRWSWRDYLLNRLTRLYIVLLPALLLGAAFDRAGIEHFGMTGLYGGHSGSHELTVPVAAHFHLAILAGNYFFLQGILVPVFGSNGPLWSLANEFWYYLAFPLLMLSFTAGRRLIERLLCLVLLAAILVFVGPSIALYFLAWLAGAVLHWLPLLSIPQRAARMAVMSLSVGLLALCLTWCKQTSTPAADFVLSLITALFVYVALCSARGEAPAVYRATAHWFSRSSYSLYLLHLPFLLFAVSLTGRIRLEPAPGQLWLLLGMFAAVLAYTQIVWFCFERNTDAIRKVLKPYVMPSRPATSGPGSSRAGS